MNLIPEKIPSPVYNYYCTFNSQARWRVKPRLTNVVPIRDRIGTEFLFGEDGVFTCYPEELRGDLIALLDDAWDVPFGTKHHDGGKDYCYLFGSMIVNEDKFTEYAHLEPRDRLKAIADRVRALGFAGIGLWVPANHHMEDTSEPREKQLSDARAFWTDRAKMCAYTDVGYIKVDWGYHGRDIAYRKIMTESFKTYSPNTLIEHVVGIFNMAFDPPPEEQCGEKYDNFMSLARQTVKIGDVYRTYDVTEELTIPTTIMRIAKLVGVRAVTDPSLAGIIGVEDNVTLAAALGMSVGMIRHTDSPIFGEVKKCLMWQRLAPPCRFEWDKFNIDETLLCDGYHYHKNKALWPYIGDEIISQWAAARISLNAPLAEVKSAESDGRVPYVINSKNQLTGAYTVAAIKRTFADEGFKIPLAEVAVSGAEADKPLGIFGDFARLTIEFDSELVGKHVYAQNLADSQAIDITDDVTLNARHLILDGELIKRVANESDDAVSAGIAIVLD